MDNIIKTEEVIELIQEMCKQGNVDVAGSNLQVSQMDNRLMGFRIGDKKAAEDARSIGKSVADIMWNDKDGSRIIAMLYTDINGQLFELDVWKSNFGMPKNISGWKENGLSLGAVAWNSVVYVKFIELLLPF